MDPRIRGVAVQALAAVSPADLMPVIEWATAIPFESWPQQPRDPERPELVRPSLVTSLPWRGFGAATDKLVARIMSDHFPQRLAYNRILSVVMPGARIHRHVDDQLDGWRARVHVPLTTCERAIFSAGDGPDRVSVMMPVGFCYLVNTKIEHEVRNDGVSPRIHFMFDVRS